MKKAAATSLLIGLIFLLAARFANAEAPLPAEAQQAFDQGQMAAGQGAWEIAILSFSEAQRKAERDPRVLYALGVAHANAGHELAGAAWLSACLLAAPEAPNAEAVQKEINRLLGVADTTAKRIFSMALDAARQIPSKNVRLNRLTGIMVDQAQIGDLAGAQATEAEVFKLSAVASQRSEGEPEVWIAGRDNVQSIMWGDYLLYLEEIEDLDEAQANSAHVINNGPRMSAMAKLAVSLALAGRPEQAKQAFTEAERCMALLTEDRSHEKVERMLNDLAVAYAQNGQADDYKRILNSARAIAEAKQFSDLLSQIAAAMEKDPAKMSMHDKGGTDTVNLELQMAKFWSEQAFILDLKGQLDQALQAKESDSPYGIESDAIAFRVQELGRLLGVSVSIFQGQMKEGLLRGFQIRLMSGRQWRDSHRRLLLRARSASDHPN